MPTQHADSSVAECVCILDGRPSNAGGCGHNWTQDAGAARNVMLYEAD